MTDLHQIIENLLAASRHLRNPAEFIEQAARALRSVEALTELAPKTPDSAKLLSAGDPAIGLLSTVVSNVYNLVHIASRRRSHTAAAADALRDKFDDLKRIHRAVVGKRVRLLDASLDDVSCGGTSVDWRRRPCAGTDLEALVELRRVFGATRPHYRSDFRDSQHTGFPGHISLEGPSRSRLALTLPPVWS